MKQVAMRLTSGVSVYDDAGSLSSIGGGYWGIPPIETYSHELGPLGHFISASATVPISPYQIPYYKEMRPGRAVWFYSEWGEEIWSGVLNQITISSPDGEVIIGPFMDIGNRVAFSYEGVTWVVGGETIAQGDQMTDFHEDTRSIAEFGRMEEIMFASRNYTEGEADRVAAALLAEKSSLKTSRVPKRGQGGSRTTVKFDCVGAIEVLKRRYWQMIMDTEYVPAYEKLNVMIDDTARDWFPRTFSELPNFVNIPTEYKVGAVLGYEEENRTVHEIISGDLQTLDRGFALAIVNEEEGGGSLGSGTFVPGGLSNSFVWLYARPGMIGYAFATPDEFGLQLGSGGKLLDGTGSPAREHMVQPGDYIATDGDYKLVETVSYSLSGGLSINFSIRGALSRAMGDSEY